VLPDFPLCLAFLALSTVSFSGIGPPKFCLYLVRNGS